jgi:hypothetical protein
MSSFAISSFAVRLDSGLPVEVSKESAASVSAASVSKPLVSSMDGLPTAGCVPVASRSRQNAELRRRVSPEAGRAIGMLGHAIEYLADEFALECRTRDASSARKHGCVQAIELLMARNREIYLSCPVVPSMAERLRGLLHLQRA